MPVPCTRCKAPASVSSPDARCLPCFKAYLQKAFKTSIGRLGAGGRPTKLAIALSGGHNSTALALLYSCYLTTLNPNPRAPPMRITLLHAANGDPPELLTHLTERLPGAKLVPVPPPPGLADALRDVKHATDASAIARALTLRALLHAAEENGCETLLLGTCANRAAADALHAAVTARGTLVRDAAAARVKSANVDIVRPVRDLPARQLVRYAMLELPDAEFVHDFGGGRKGLYDLVDRFIGEVGADNSASVHNVVKTAEKLLVVEGRPCGICGAAVVGKCDGCECGNEGQCGDTLCVGCQDCLQRDSSVRRVVDMADTERRRRKEREKMRVAIQDFIL